MADLDRSHDPGAASWVSGAAAPNSEFPVQNLPFGVFSPAGEGPRIGAAIGDCVLDLRACAAAGLLDAALEAALAHPTLNALLTRPRADRRALRLALFDLLTAPEQAPALSPHLHPIDAVALHAPCAIGDYTDFYAGIHHARAVGALFRPDAPLLPNYRHVPIGYHGRASSITASGAPVRRPRGQLLEKGADAPVFELARRLDYEVELGIWIAGENALGAPVPIADADARIAGFCLLNDWSARDIQAWEYQPLGPFLAKSFHTTISPWIVTAEALAPFRTAQAPRAPGDPAPLAYLWNEADQARGAYAITLEAHLRTARMQAEGAPSFRLSAASARALYWTPAQLIAHHASNGCNLRPGDLLGTGTISGPMLEQAGSLLELSQNGARLIALPNGESRAFLEDGDEVSLRARADAPGFVPIGFGACVGRVIG